MYLVFQIEENGRFYAWKQRIRENENIKDYLYNKNVLSVNVVQTKKRAREIVEAWTAEYKAQDRYLYDLPF